MSSLYDDQTAAMLRDSVAQLAWDEYIQEALAETEETRAQRLAQEVREKNPGMQVQRRTRREA